MRYDPKEVAFVAAPMLTSLMRKSREEGEVFSLENVETIIRDRARTALSHARILLDEAHKTGT